MSCLSVVALLVLPCAVQAGIMTDANKKVSFGLGRRLQTADEGAACLAACPKVADAMKAPDMMNQAFCADLAGTKGCLQTEADCSATAKSMWSGAPASDVDQYYVLQCKKLDLKCDEEGEKIMADADCAASMTGWMTDGCDKDQAAGTLKEACCPHAEGIFKCYPVECTNIQSGLAKIMSEHASTAEEKMEKKKELNGNMEIGKVCPKTGVVSSSSDVDTIVSSGGETHPPKAAVADFATPAQATPVVALAAMVLAVFA